MRLLLFAIIAFHTLQAAPPAPGKPPAESNPVLKPDDSIRMDVFEEPELNTQTRILKSGEVVLPLIGAVKISGLTVSQANDAIRNLYAQDYLVDPKLTLTIEEYSQDFFSVIGAVRSPGQFSIPANGKFDLSAALASAGGLAPEANVNGIILTRASGESSTHSASAIQDGAPVALRPGDRITVPQSPFVNKTVTILGPVGKAGPVPFPVDGRLDIVAAIAMAGGFSELANTKKVSVNRKGKIEVVNVKEMTARGDQRYFLQPDDIVTVAERIW